MLNEYCTCKENVFKCYSRRHLCFCKERDPTLCKNKCYHMFICKEEKKYNCKSNTHYL